jgi:uncharacterized protein
VPEDAKEDALRIITERILPGRSGKIRAPFRRELAATLVLRMPISEWSMKVSAGRGEKKGAPHAQHHSCRVH